MPPDVAQLRFAEMPFLEHVRELRVRLIVSFLALGVAFAAAFGLYNHYIGLLTKPFGDTLYTTRIEQAFTTKVRISAYAAVLFSLPVHLYNIVRFILPALKPRERRALGWLLCGSLLLLLFGGYMGYCHILPLSLQFLRSKSFVPDNVSFWLDYRENLTFVAQMMVAFLVLFQVPLLLLVLMSLNIISRQALLHWSRYIVIVIFIVSAIMTPPDVVSQLGLAVPLILLFFLTILIARVCRFGEAVE